MRREIEIMDDEKQPTYLKIDLGEQGPDYQAPNLLSALDQLASYFQNIGMSAEVICDTLKLYAKHTEVE